MPRTCYDKNCRFNHYKEHQLTTECVLNLQDLIQFLVSVSATSSELLASTGLELGFQTALDSL